MNKEVSVEVDKKIVKSYFAKFDTDGSGTINQKELSDLIVSLGFKELPKQKVVALAKYIDQDDSKSIDFEEFYKFWKDFSKDGFNGFNKKINAIYKAYKLFKEYDKVNFKYK
jgi:Ca2+-binding EF-hand superfamily protein